MKKKSKLLFWVLFLCPDNVLTFVGGIMVAVSVNILTSQIPESALTLGWTYILAAVILFVIAVILLWWSIIIKPFQTEYNDSVDIQGDLGTLVCWYNIINKNTQRAKSARKKLMIFLFLLILLSVLCIILLFFSDELNYVVECACEAVNSEKVQ